MLLHTALHALQFLPHQAMILFPGTFCSGAGSFNFNDSARVKNLDYGPAPCGQANAQNSSKLFSGSPGQKRAVSRPRLEQANRFKDRDRLADAVSPHTQRLGQGAFGGQAAIRPQFSGDYKILELFKSLIADTRSVDSFQSFNTSWSVAYASHKRIPNWSVVLPILSRHC
ncbi:MAG: hypothetical protein OXB89_12080 [Anaerolineaceae bacterium]|nr:hypothetical protein [Anaerolineaceae bacterium]